MNKPMGYNEKLAMSQGWILADDAERGLEIQRYDCDPAERFTSDSHALAFVEFLASQDPFSHAAFCLRYIEENSEPREREPEPDYSAPNRGERQEQAAGWQRIK